MHWLKCIIFQENYLAPEFIKLVKYCQEDKSDFDGVLELVKETNGELCLNFCTHLQAS